MGDEYEGGWPENLANIIVGLVVFAAAYLICGAVTP